MIMIETMGTISRNEYSFGLLMTMTDVLQGDWVISFFPLVFSFANLSSSPPSFPPLVLSGPNFTPLHHAVHSVRKKVHYGSVSWGLLAVVVGAAFIAFTRRTKVKRSLEGKIDRQRRIGWDGLAGWPEKAVDLADFHITLRR